MKLPWRSRQAGITVILGAARLIGFLIGFWFLLFLPSVFPRAGTLADPQNSVVRKPHSRCHLELDYVPTDTYVHTFGDRARDYLLVLFSGVHIPRVVTGRCPEL